ncbi:hypothetical protein KK120_10655 [Virgibacillus dakarensis]|uniref:hypothetical protein n=1 Tax=Virgibacillus dakarensis TaxID=1917889 RepID=UPI000B4451C7|nr:hypothetical protein [Virgibacillus dakarensis]MBT2216284.1 hypothetical protein [Virgibacillus dakarensis]
MAGQAIKIDFVELQNILSQLRTGIDDFTGYTTTFRSNTSDRLEAFNSDFIAKVDALLDNMNNDVNQDLVNQMETIYQAGKAVLDGMKQVDEEAAKAIGGDGS